MNVYIALKGTHFFYLDGIACLIELKSYKLFSDKLNFRDFKNDITLLYYYSMLAHNNYSVKDIYLKLSV